MQRKRRQQRARKRKPHQKLRRALVKRALHPVYDQARPPLREWDRATQLMSVFAVSGFITEQTPQGDLVPSRPASILLVGGPGSGKTELVERFKRCSWLSYHNDLTVRSLLPLLHKADEQILTHVAAPEFNKWFQRKGFVAENCIGLLSSAMEEGVTNYDVGPMHLRFKAARLGLFGGMTPRTMDRRRLMLSEMGFLSRVCAIEWRLPREERDEIQRRINLGILDDLDPVDLVTPEVGQRVTIAWDERIGEQVIRYVRAHWPENDMRVFKRFKTLLLARAYLVHHARVSVAEWEWLQSYDDYWKRMLEGEE